MKFIITRVDFNLLITLDETKIEHIEGDFYKIPFIYYDSEKFKVVYEKPQKAWEFIAVKYKNTLYGLIEINPIEGVKKTLQYCKNYSNEEYEKRILAFLDNVKEKMLDEKDENLIPKILDAKNKHNQELMEERALQKKKNGMKKKKQDKKKNSILF